MVDCDRGHEKMTCSTSHHPLVHRRFGRTLTWLFAGLTLLIASSTAAQTPSPSSSPDASSKTRRIVILNVPGGGTQKLVSRIRKIERTEIKRQGWFISELRRHDLQARGIMSRRQDLHVVLNESAIDFLLFLRPADDDYTAKLLDGSSARPAVTVDAERTNDGLSEAGAKQVGRAVAEHLAPAPPKQTSASSGTSDEKSPETQDNSRPDDTAETSTDTSRKAPSTPLRFWSSIRSRFFHRSFTATGADNAVLRYNSGTYPGLEVDLELFPFGPVAEKFAPLGIFVNYNHGFASIAVGTDGGGRRNLALTHLEIEGGLLARAGGHLADQQRGAYSQFRLKATARHSRFTVDVNETLPSVSTTAVVLGGLVTEPILVDNLAAQARLELIPIAFFQQGGLLFGDSSYTNGFATRLGLLYVFPKGLRAVAGYRFRLLHSRFTGQGSSAFRNSEVFELVQGIDVGIQYAY